MESPFFHLSVSWRGTRCHQDHFQWCHSPGEGSANTTGAGTTPLPSQSFLEEDGTFPHQGHPHFSCLVGGQTCRTAPQSPSAPDETLELPNLGISVAGKNLLQKKKAPSKIHKSLIPGGEGTKLYLSFIYQSEKNSTVRCNTSSVYIWSLSRKRDARGDYKPAKTAFKALPTLLFTRATVIFLFSSATAKTVNVRFRNQTATKIRVRNWNAARSINRLSSTNKRKTTMCMQWLQGLHLILQTLCQSSLRLLCFFSTMISAGILDQERRDTVNERNNAGWECSPSKMGEKREKILVYINLALSRTKANNSCLVKSRKQTSQCPRMGRVTHEQLPLISSRRIKTHFSAFPLQAGSDGTQLLGAGNAALG